MATTAIPTPTATDRQVREWVRRVALDGAEFSREILGHRTWPVQEEIIHSLENNPRTAVAGCHASSKSHSAAEAAIAWLTRYDDGVVRITAPTQHQARGGIWKEIRKAVSTARVIEYPEPGEYKWIFSDKNFAEIRAAGKGGRGVKFQALHEGHVLILVDEAPGVEGEIFEAIEGIRAGGQVHVGIFGNPTVPGGYFYEAFTQNRDMWNCITIDGLDTPNLEGLTLDDLVEMPLDPGGPLDDNPWPFLITRRFVREMLEYWGETNPRFEARVRGRFPQLDEDALIPLMWLEAARNREPERSGARLSAGIDVAGGGRAENVLYIVDRGHIVTNYPVTSTGSVDHATGQIVAALEEFRGDLGSVYYDDIGVGSRLGTILRERRFNAVGVNVGLPAYDKERFERSRDELFWTLREMFRRGEIAGLDDETTIAQLSSIRYEYTATGKIKIESKKAMAKRGLRSPDRADALMLALTGSIGGVDGQMSAPSPTIRSRFKWKP